MSVLARAIGDIFLKTRDRHRSRVDAELARLAATARGSVGVSALHLETGSGVALNGATRFPMASAVKIPVAVQLLSRVDRGELALDAMVPVEPQHLRPGAGIITRRFRIPGAAFSIRNLLELALIVSDNTAADMVIDLAGGMVSVRERLQDLGIADMSIDRTMFQLVADVEGITELPQGVTLERWRAMRAAVPLERRCSAERAFLDDVRDTATPEAMTRLLAEVWNGRALSRAATSLLFDILARCETGADRLKGSLPLGTPVAHKTGTIDSIDGHGARHPPVVNDVGIIDLPGGAHVAIAVFIKGSASSAQAQAGVVARIARTVYDSFLTRGD